MDFFSGGGGKLPAAVLLKLIHLLFCAQIKAMKVLLWYHLVVFWCQGRMLK